MRYHDLLTDVNIKSPQFQQWFKGSRVVDLATKAPLICYHGTTKPHEIQPAAHQHFGTFKAADERIDYLLRHHNVDYIEAPHIYPVYLSIKNPLPLEDDGEWEDADVVSNMHQQGLIDDKTLEDFQSGDAYNTYSDWISLAKHLGYDGMVYENYFEDVGSTSWYPFSDHQVWNIFANKPY